MHWLIEGAQKYMGSCTVKNLLCRGQMNLYTVKDLLCRGQMNLLSGSYQGKFSKNNYHEHTMFQRQQLQLA
jgi:UDP-glucose 4-epimerase